MSFKLRGIEFGHVFVASGTLNFSGEGWRHHQYMQCIPGFSFYDVTLITKTTTLHPRAGNMPLNENWQPREFRPKCIYVDFRKEVVLNAVGLSGPGAKAILNSGKWQQLERPFVISFMSVADSPDEQLKELQQFCLLLLERDFKAPFALEINISCPNTKHNTLDLVKGAAGLLSLANMMLRGVPIVLKISVLVEPSTIKDILSKASCDAIDVSNTIPFGQLPDQIDWHGLFPSKTGELISPLAKFGGGGLSGKPLFPLVYDWLLEAKRIGIDLPIIAGGGVLCKEGAKLLFNARVSGISIGSAAILRPYRVQGIIDHINKLFRDGPYS